MITAALVLLAVAPQTKPPSYLEDAYLGGHLESAIGLKPHPTIVFGQYISRVARLSNNDLSGYLELNPRDALARQPVQVGYVSFKVTNSVFEGKPCVLFESEGTRNRVREFKDENKFNVVNATPIQRYRKVWLSPEGLPLKETSGFRNYQGTYEIDAIFKKDEIELTTAWPKGRRTVTIFPAGGVELFANEFKPMVDGEKVLLPEKKFSRLDPITGGVVQITAKVAAKFEGSVFLKKFVGHRIDYTIGDHMEVAFVSYGMDMLQVNIPHGESLVAQVDPTADKVGTTRIKTGGGG